MSKYLVEISNLTIINQKSKEQTMLVKGIDLSIPKGKIVGIVGESGSGKSLTMKSLMGILPKGLEASYDRFEMDGKQVRKPKVLPLSMIFQDPMTSLNPLRTVGFHLREVLRRFQPKLTKEEREVAILEMLDKVGISNPELRLKQFPFEFSGGMRRRLDAERRPGAPGASAAQSAEERRSGHSPARGRQRTRSHHPAHQAESALGGNPGGRQRHWHEPRPAQ